MARRRTPPPAAPVEEEVFEEVDELEDPEEDIEELTEEVEEPPPAPRKRGRPAAKKTAAPAKKAPPTPMHADKVEFDSTWLAEHVTEETGTDYTASGVRALLRKLAKDGTLDREVGVEHTRYSFPKGPNDPTVKRVVSLVKSGAATAIRREGLNQVTAAKAAATKVTPAKKAAAKAVPAKKTATPARRRAAPRE